MKGVIFTEFIEMVEDKFSFDIKDEMLKKAKVDGIYTQAGNYPTNELLSMIKALAQLSNISTKSLIYTYGMHLFTVLIRIYPKSIESYKSSFEFISNVENVIHPEVKKLYPDSQLPTFEIISIKNNEMKIIYKSTKPLMELAKGLMMGCAKYYNENLYISYKKMEMNNDKFEALFTLVSRV